MSIQKCIDLSIKKIAHKLVVDLGQWQSQRSKIIPVAF